jgi:hypothetical protein
MPQSALSDAAAGSGAIVARRAREQQRAAYSMISKFSRCLSVIVIPRPGTSSSSCR